MLHSAPSNYTCDIGFEGSSMNSTVILLSISNVLPFSNKFKKYDPSHYTPSARNFLSKKRTEKKSIP
jgi:hypothetical protein